VADVRLIAAICPSCGASLQIPEGLQNAHCVYCGTQVFISHKRTKCKVCDGLGRLEICRACDGKGFCTWQTNSPGVRGNDFLMLGYSSACIDGMCAACKGTGRYLLGPCPGCEGTGKCPRCLGTGKCLACHGMGLFPDTRGAEQCLSCGGTGFVDPGAPELPSLGRCPDCKRVWREDSPHCWYCGFKRNHCPSCGEPWIQGRLSCVKCGFGKNQKQR